MNMSGSYSSHKTHSLNVRIQMLITKFTPNNNNIGRVTNIIKRNKVISAFLVPASQRVR